MAKAAPKPEVYGPPTPEQMYAAAPGVRRSTAVDTDGARLKSLEENSVIQWIAVGLATSRGESRVTPSTWQEAKKQWDGYDETQRKSTYAQWKNNFLSALDNAEEGDVYWPRKKGDLSLSSKQADSLHDAADQLRKDGWLAQDPSNTDALASLLQGKGYDSFKIPFWNTADRHGAPVWDPFWQNDTSVGYVDESDGLQYANPMTTGYVVTDGAHKGDFVLVTAPNGVSVFMRALDTNNSEGINGNDAGRQAEISPGGWDQLGYQGQYTAKGPPVNSVKTQLFEGSGAGKGELGYLTPAETQEAGKLIQSGVVKSIRNRDDLVKARAEAQKQKDAAEKKKQQEEEKKKAQEEKKKKQSGMRVLTGAKTVFAGPLQREVAYASADSVHEGGGYFIDGSKPVSVENHPLVRITDPTSDGYRAVWGLSDVQSA